MSIVTKTMAFAGLCAMMISGVAVAADTGSTVAPDAARAANSIASVANSAASSTAAMDAERVSRQIDEDLQRSASDFNRELAQVEDQLHESQRLGQPVTTANRYGIGPDIDREIQSTADHANQQLERAWHRDEYTKKRRDLMNTQSLYYPGSEQYNRFSEEIENLDREFAGSAS